LGKNFDIPPGCEQNEINRLIALLEDRIEDSQKLINQTRQRLRDYLKEIQKVSQS
jgi:hypothetical protein